MNTEDINRQKSAMVIFAFERALGDYVNKHHDSMPDIDQSGALKKIEGRVGLSGGQTRKARVGLSVASSYLEEIMNLAAECSNATSEADSFKVLQNLSASLDLWAIRNAVSHPNRPFPDCYWYRSATLASDPSIDKLGFTSVKLALQAAEEERITLPPEEWFQIQCFSVRNNLPTQFEHESTGLIGRQKEKRDLVGALSSGKYPLVAVVAPGGLGKTALTLDVLRECIFEPKSQEWCDAIVFITLKQETLTAEGVVQISASVTLDEVGRELKEELETLYPDIDCSSLFDVQQRLAEQRVVVCIDNLETLLVNDQDSFTKFFESLPERWRVLITSRITVDGAKTLTIGALSPEGAKSLVYKYMSTKGIESAEEKTVSQIILASSGNPLALRLIVDRYINGHSLPAAASQAGKDIVAFSYKNLVDTLSDNSVLILEALFVKDRFVRGEIVEALSLDDDAVAEAVRQLTRTSLVLRKSDGNDEYFSLSPSIRDLLRDHPRNLAIRQRVRLNISNQAKAVRLHKTIQAQHGFSAYSEDYITEDCPSNLGAVLVTAIKLLRSEACGHHQLIAVIDRLNQVGKSYPTNYLISLSLGRLYLRANDDVGAEALFKQAMSVSSASPAPRIVYCDFLLKRERPDDASKITQSLIDDGWGNENKGDEFTARRVWGMHFRALVENQAFDVVSSLVDTSSGPAWFLELCRCVRAQVIVCKAQPIHTENPKAAIEALAQAAKLLSVPPSHERIRGVWWTRSCKLFCRELAHFFAINKDFTVSASCCSSLIGFVRRNFAEVYESASLYSVQNEAIPVLRALKKCASKEEQDVFENAWVKQILVQDVTDPSAWKKLASEGYVIVTVYKVPFARDNLPQFVFAEDEHRNRYFIGIYACKNYDPVSWAQLRVGSKFAARDFVKPASSEYYPNPREALILK